jgi:hypothetical protein
VLPKLLHLAAIRGNLALAILVRALRGMVEKQKTLLLVPDADLPLRVIGIPMLTAHRLSTPPTHVTIVTASVS